MMTTISTSQANLIQRALRETVEPTLKLDGKLGPLSLKAFQKLSNELGMGSVDEFSGPVFDTLLEFIKKRYVGDEAYAEVASFLGVEEAIVRAVAQVESKGKSFNNDGSLVILYERHWFRNKLAAALKRASTQEHVVAVLGLSGIEIGKSDSDRKILDLVSQKHPDLCNAARGGYTVGAEWDRLERAINIHPDSAYQSASYGGFQIMGFNHAACGYNTAAQMLIDFAESENNQFMAVAKFIKADAKLHEAMRKRDWATFARIYNGSAYAEHKYDIRLADAYSFWKKTMK